MTALPIFDASSPQLEPFDAHTQPGSGAGWGFWGFGGWGLTGWGGYDYTVELSTGPSLTPFGSSDLSTPSTVYGVGLYGSGIYGAPGSISREELTFALSTSLAAVSGSPTLAVFN